MNKFSVGDDVEFIDLGAPLGRYPLDQRTGVVVKIKEQEDESHWGKYSVRFPENTWHCGASQLILIKDGEE